MALNLGHRGASAAAPENTLAAFRRALELGADGFELDVTLSKDGETVVIHDDTVDRTTDGRGDVSEMTLAEIKRLDAGAWFAPKFAGERIPILQEVFDLAGGKAFINIEIKSRTISTNGIEQQVVELVRRNQLVDRVIISCFNPFALWRVKRIAPWLATGLLYAEDLPPWLSGAWAAPFLGLKALHPKHTMVDAAYMGRAKAKGYQVNVWTVDQEPDMQRLLALGVHGIITNRPDVLRKVKG